MATDESTLAILVRASTVITAIGVRSLNAVAPQVTVVQARALVIVWGLGSANVSAVARGLGANASNASRTCDRLVTAGLLTREQADGDRRHVVLRLSSAGQELIDSVMHQRCAELDAIASRLSATQQRQLCEALEGFVAAADAIDAGSGDLIDHHLLRWMS